MEYIIYCRKSTEDSKRQIQSIESQHKELLKMAKDRDLKIKEVYTESMSAKAPGRPVFNKMMDKIAENPGMGLLVWKLDRLARNPVDGGRLIWAVEKGLIPEIITFERKYSNTIDDKFIMNLDFGVPKMYVDQLSINVKRGNRTKLEKGGWPNHAPLGYLNNKLDNTIIIDKKISPYIFRAFSLCATGNYSLKQIADILYAEGFRTRTGKRVFKGTIERILKKTFYYGVMERDGKLYNGNHKSIISKQLFDDTQNALSGRIRPKNKKRFFVYQGFLKCASCGCVYTSTNKKGHDYHYCTNGKGICEAHKSYLRSEKIDRLIIKAFEEIKFDEEFIEISYEAYKEQSQKDVSYVANIKENIEKELQIVRNKKAKLLETYLSELVSRSDYEAKMKELENAEIGLENQIKNAGAKSGTDENTLEQIKDIFLTASRAKKDFLSRDPYQKRELLEILLWNLEIENEKIAHSRFKEPYNILANTPKNCDFSTMLPSQVQNITNAMPKGFFERSLP